MTTWVMGDSIVANAGKNGDQLTGGGHTIWSGLSGARCAGLNGRLLRLMNKSHAPTTLILHLGTNDILKSSTWEISKRVKENIKGIRQLLSHTRIIWSDIMIRLAYADEIKKGAGLAATRNVNKTAHKICREEIKTNVHVITHSSVFNRSNLRVDGKPIYKWDGTHPSDFGSYVFRQTLSQALTFFNANPGSFSYPPGSADV